MGSAARAAHRQPAPPPKLRKKDVNYFQPGEIATILDALEYEPLKWRTITHLLIVSALLYSTERGVYEDTTKTGNVRFLNLPAETIVLL